MLLPQILTMGSLKFVRLATVRGGVLRGSIGYVSSNQAMKAARAAKSASPEQRGSAKMTGMPDGKTTDIIRIS
jgi:hypothetical protein